MRQSLQQRFAVANQVHILSSSVYEDAFRLAEDLPDEDSGKGVSAISRIRSRAATLERVAVASSVFATIQDAKASDFCSPSPVYDSDDRL